VLVICALLKVQQTALIGTCTAILTLLPFFIGLERDKLKPRDIMPIVVFVALAVAGRILFAPLPNFKPVSALVIMAGINFGKRSGFMVGALAALASNLFFGEGPWTPWQMYAWGLMGYVAGIFAANGMLKHRLSVFIYGFFAPIAYGLILDSYYFVGFVGETNLANALAAYSIGLLSSLVHAVATVVFLVPIYLPWQRKLKRLKSKYGIAEN
jgi:energy-coupling factor transport system substrate-specific component